MSLAAALACLLPGVASAQAQAQVTVPSQTTTTTATETKAFEVIAVSADSLVLQLPEGRREMSVDGSFAFMVDGKPMEIRDLQPGMKGLATITTTTYTTPQTRTDIKNAKVTLVGAGNIVMRTADGQTKRFNQQQVDEQGVTLIRDGKPAMVADFRAGERVSATVVTSAPPRVVKEQSMQATLEPLAPAPQAAEVTPEPAPEPELIAANTADTPAPAGTSGRGEPDAVGTSGFSDALPTTAGEAPAIALVGLSALVMGTMLVIRRRRREL